VPASVQQPLPSLDVIAAQVVSERETMNAHAESLDSKAGVILGFAGVLVGLGATAQTFVSSDLTFKIGLCLAVAAALFAASAFWPRKYPVVEVLPLRDFLTAPEDETKLTLLDVQIDMVVEAAVLVRRKGRRLKAAVGLLAVAAALIVVGTLIATGDQAQPEWLASSPLPFPRPQRPRRLPVQPRRRTALIRRSSATSRRARLRRPRSVAELHAFAARLSLAIA